MGTVLVACVADMTSTAAAGRALSLDPDITLALVPRTVTVALGLPIAQLLGASNGSITAAVIVVTGLLGAAFAQTLLTRMGYSDPIVRGSATAASAHGLGTAALSADEPARLPPPSPALCCQSLCCQCAVCPPGLTAAPATWLQDALPVAALVFSMMGIVATLLAAIPAFRSLILALAGAA